MENALPAAEVLYSDGKVETPDARLLIKPGHEVHAGNLAALLDPVSFYGDLTLAAPWTGIVRTVRFNRATPPVTAPPGQYPTAWKRVWRKTVGKLISRHERIAVSFSGGLDSTAVLCALCEAAPRDREIIVVSGDYGAGDVEQMRRLVAAVTAWYCRPVAHLVTRRLAPPPWAEEGPSRLGMPWAAGGLAAEALDRGATILLYGTGADELLAVNRFLSAGLMRSKLRHLPAYWRLAGELNGSGLMAECMGLAGKLLPRRLRALAFIAATDVPLHTERPDMLLAPRYREYTHELSRGYRRALRETLEQERSWAAMDFRESLLPLEMPMKAGLVEEACPFLSQPFLDHALAAPLTDRFDARHRCSYHRRKALVLALIPGALHGALPVSKDHYGAAMVRLVTPDPPRPERLLDHGLLDPGRFRESERKSAVFMPALRAMESWLRQAEERGHPVQPL